MKPSFLCQLFLLVLCAVPLWAPGADAPDVRLYAGQYELARNLWGIRGAGPHWRLDTVAPSGVDMTGAGYTWSGFEGSTTSVKAYPSIRFGASNKRNIPATSGLPYRFGDNTRSLEVLWDFDAQSADGDGPIAGKYNHTLDIFFNATPSTRQAEIRGEIMVITDSSQDARTAGWGARDAVPFVIDGATWDVWQATQVSNGYSWHVTQFRRRVNAHYFRHDLRDFFAAAAARRPDVFSDRYYVMMVEAGTEIKTGAGRVVHKAFRVRVAGASVAGL